MYHFYATLVHRLIEVMNIPSTLDDSFVHFDRLRLLNMVQLLEEIKGQHQIIYFTCHDSLWNEWQDTHIIHVANL